MKSKDTYKCDRCGKIEIPGKFFDEMLSLKVDLAIRESFLLPWKIVDLCPACRQKLHDFIFNSEEIEPEVIDSDSI